MDVNAKMITIARESRGLTQLELCKKIQVEPSALSRMEFGTLGVREEVLERLSKELDYPATFFRQSFPFVPPNVHYRKKVTLSPKIIRKSDALMNIYRANIDKALKVVALNQSNLPILDEQKTRSPEDIAMYLRSFWGIEKGPIVDLVSLVEKQGIIVVFFDYGTDKIDGRSMISESGVPIIFLNKHFPGDRLRLTLAHELGHIIMHLRTLPTFGRDEEDEAFRFAAEFLMPLNEVRLKLSPKIKFEELYDLKRVWRVSIKSIIFKGEQNKRFTPNHAKYLWSQYSSQGFNRGEPLPIEIDSPTLLKRIINLLLTEGEYTKKDLAELFTLSEEEFTEKFSEASVVIPNRLRIA